MKFSDYLNVDPSPKKVPQTFNIRDENREAILEQQIVEITNRLTKSIDQTSELEDMRKQKKALENDKRELSNNLNNTQSTLETVHSQLENESHLKQSIKALELQLQVLQQYLEESAMKNKGKWGWTLKPTIKRGDEGGWNYGIEGKVVW